MTQLNILCLIAIIPVLIILFYIYGKDKNKEPKKLLIKLFFSGILSCFLVFVVTDVIEMILPIIKEEATTLNMIELLIYVFIGIALVEEFCKWVMTYSIGYNNKEYDEFYDGIVYSVFVALGFALFENLLYVLGSSSVSTGIQRGLLAVPGHACFGLYMGYYLSKAKLSQRLGKKDKEKLYLVLSLLIPMILHGIYDYCLFVGNVLFLIIFIVFIISLYIYTIIKIKKSSKNIIEVNNNSFCKYCGNPLTGPYCSNCGGKQD